MPRIARIVIPGRPHHVTQRGNDRQDVFFADGDYAVYLDTLREQASRFGLAFDAYCYSSAKAHVENADPANLLDWRGFRGVVPPAENWRHTLQRPADNTRLATLRLIPQSVGRPLKARRENVKN